MDKDRNILCHRKLGNRNLAVLLRILKPYRDSLVVAAESCFSWYWLADFCEENGFEFILGHALYMKAVHGGKAKNDKIDSRKIALLVQGGMFPLAYVYPRKHRSLRDLLRRRLAYVRQKTTLITQIQIQNYQGNQLPLGKLSKSKTRRASVADAFENPDTRLGVEGNLSLIDHYDLVIRELESHIMARARDAYPKELAILQSISGIGRTLSLTILFEIGSLDRFKTHQQLASYSRLVKCAHESGGKKTGYGGRKIGNPYLKHAFSEAAVYAARHNPRIKKVLHRLEQKHGKAKSKIVLAHKICRAVFYMLKNGKAFDEKHFLTN
jgi:transposase